MNFSHLNFGNNFVSMHQFSSTTKIVESVSQNISFIQGSSAQVNSPNNGQDTVTQHQHYFQDAPTRVLCQNSFHAVNTPPSSATAQTSWVDSTSTISPGENILKINLPNFPPLSQGSGNNLSHPFQVPFKTKLMKDASTMTDNDITFTDIINVKEAARSEDSKDSSKLESHSVKKSACSNSCPKVEPKSSKSGFSEYLLRLQPHQIPQDMHDFLEHNNVLPVLKNDEQKSKKDDETKDAFNGRPDNSLSNALDDSGLFYCGECDIGYTEKDLLDRHLTVHKPLRRFECDVCGVFLKRKEHLDQHKRGHSEERPFVCKICSKGFKRNEHLRRHAVIHSGDKNYTCITCGKSFSRKDHLNKHSQTHINKKEKTEQGDPTSSLNHKNMSMLIHQSGPDPAMK